MRRIVLFAIIGLTFSLTGRAKADLAIPLPPAKDAVAVKIEVDDKAKGPRLVVPQGVFLQLRGRPQPKAPQGAIERDGADGIADADNPVQPRNHLLFAGIALAMSMAFGGLWLFRKNGKGSIRSLTLLIAAGAALTAGAVVWANAPPAPTKDKPAAKAYPSAYEGKASVEFVFGQEPVRLILDKESYEKLKKEELKEVAATEK